MSASGHVPSGQTPIDSLVRECKEEIGLDVQKAELKFLGKFWRHEIYREDFIENELDYIYILNKKIKIKDLKLQKEEVNNVKWIKLAEFEEMIRAKKVVSRPEIWEALFNYYQK